ncbi:MAG TPA: TadE family protein [Rhizomicrobium sp.]|nr:TadE family protein [Rhizomicrobium sp.]
MGQKIWRKLLDCARGTAAIEFAILGGVFSAVMVVSGDLGLAFYANMQVQTSAQVGAQYAVVNGKKAFDATAISNAVVSATSTTGISATPAPVQFCACPSGTTLTTWTCGTKCPDEFMPGTYAKVSASRTHTTLIPYPGLPASFAQTATSTVRIK